MKKVLLGIWWLNRTLKQNFHQLWGSFYLLCDSVNKQNYQIWDFSKPSGHRKNTFASRCIFICKWSGRRHYVKFRALLTHVSRSCLKREDYNLADMWCQHNGEKSHTSLVNRALLQKKFPGSVILRLHDVSWPTASYDLGLFLWNYVKDCVYIDNP